MKTKKINNNYSNGHRTFFKAMLFAIAGLIYAIKSEDAIKLELVTLCVLIPVSIKISSSWIEFIILIIPCFILIITELLNTAIEKTIDRVSFERHPLAKVAKDTAAAAVFISVVLLLLTWLSKIILWLYN